MPDVDNTNDSTIRATIELPDEYYNALCERAQKHQIPLGKAIQRHVVLVRKRFYKNGNVWQFNDQYRFEQESYNLACSYYEIEFDIDFYDLLSEMTLDALWFYLATDPCDNEQE